MKITQISLTFIVCTLTVSCVSSSQPSHKNVDHTSIPVSRGFQIGIAGLVPRHFPESSEADYLDFIDEIPRLGEFFGVYAAWDDPFLTEQIEIAQQMKDIIPLVILGFDYQKVNEGYFTENRDAIIQTLLEISSAYDMPYLGFGGEVNRLASEISEVVYQEFINLYLDGFNALKAEKPDLQVFTVFQYEYMTGSAFLSGLGVDPQWNSLFRFEGKLDLAAFTIYPFLDHKQVEDIPVNYFQALNQNVNLPIIITETGWPSENVVINGQVLVSGNQEAQSEYLDWIIQSTEDLKAEILMYSFLHDIPRDLELFNSVALKQNDGTPKPAYTHWVALAGRPFVVTE